MSSERTNSQCAMCRYESVGQFTFRGQNDTRIHQEPLCAVCATLVDEVGCVSLQSVVGAEAGPRESPGENPFGAPSEGGHDSVG